MKRPIYLRSVAATEPRRDEGWTEDLLGEALPLRGVAPLAQREVERTGKLAGVRQVQQPVRARAQLCGGDSRVGSGGSFDGDARKPSGPGRFCGARGD